MARQEWTSRAAQLEGQVLNRSREPWLQCSRCEPGLLSGPLFWLVSCTALQPKSCFLHWNVKTQSKQFRVSASVTIYPLQRGFDGEQHHEDTSSARHHFSLGIREGPISPRGTASQSSATGIEALWGWAPLWPPPNTLHPAAKKGPVAAWAMVCLRQVEIFAHRREFPAWRGMGRCPSFLQCSPRGGGEAVIFCCQKWAR